MENDVTRIVINPSTFKNGKDALCVAFNERFRIAMEQYGFEPQSEPTDRQRRFFSDTAYADDEVQLRRTILARILTLDTSIKDPTDEQLREALGFLREFKRRERPSNDWEASAIERLEILVQTVVNKGKRAVPKPRGGTVQADIGGGTTEDDEEDRQQTEEPAEPVEEASPQTETTEPAQPVEQPSAEPQVAAPESPEPGQIVTNNGVVMTEEESQRTADELKKSLFGDADNSADAAITDEPKVPEAPKVPEEKPQTTTPETAPAQTAPAQTAPAQTAPAQTAPAQTAPAQTAPAQTAQPEPVTNQVGRWTTKNQRRMRRYLRALYGKDYAYAAVYGASPMAKPPAKAVPRKKA
jgi:hypothetical protein